MEYREDLNPLLVQKRFPLLELELCKELVEVSKWMGIPEGKILLQDGNYIKTFPLVLDGVFKVSRNDEGGKENLLYYLTAGQVCSMALTCCMGNVQSNIQIVAEKDSDILSVPISYLDEWIIKYPSWKIFVMQAYKQRFDEMLETIDSLAFKKMDARLISFFKSYNRSTKKTVYQGKHEDIASALTSSREVISRLLKVLENEGLITLSRNRIDFEKLVE